MAYGFRHAACFILISVQASPEMRHEPFFIPFISGKQAMAAQIKSDIHAEVFTEFAKRRATITRMAIVMGILIGVISMLAYSGVASKSTAVIFLVLFFVYGAIVNARKWRCPACNGHLGKLYFGLQAPRHCPRCGVQLIEG